MGRLVTTKNPFPSVVVEWTAPVPVFAMLTSAPGMMAPVESATVPSICPSEVCAWSDMLKPIRSKKHRRSQLEESLQHTASKIVDFRLTETFK
jgi:hypothetical protein